MPEATHSAVFKYLATRPELPSTEAWSPILQEAYARNWFTNFGGLSRQLEAAFENRWGFENTACVVTSSATSGLAAALISMEVEGKVLLPAFTFPASYSAIKMAGCEPVVVDVQLKDMLISPEVLSDALAKTEAKGVMLVSPFGHQSDHGPLLALARDKGIKVVVDSAAGLGLSRENLERSSEVCEVYSMHATKPFGVGEGGVAFLNKKAEASFRCAANFGLSKYPEEKGPEWGINAKMSEFHAAIALAVLDTYDDRMKRRRDFVREYIALFQEYEALGLFADVESSTWQVFPVMMPTERAASKFCEMARKNGLEVRRYYRPSLSKWPGAKIFDSCPNAEELADRMCCLPVYSYFSDAELAEIIDISASALDGALAAQ